MTETQWEVIRKCAALEEFETVPVGLIVDSPWIPAYVGISTLDYLIMPDRWLEANLQVQLDFPDIIFLPGFWIEMGMATEPSGFGCKISFFHDKTPAVYPAISSADQIDRISLPNPHTDGLMPLILNLYRNVEKKVNAAGHRIKVVAARGPLAVAAHLMGMTEFLIAVKTDPDAAHRLLSITTTNTKNWLEAQANELHDVEGVMILDDIAGFLSAEDYLKFAHPYLKEIYGAFPTAVRFFHCDTDNDSMYRFLNDLQINIFNFTHLIDISKARECVGSKVCLMGNVPPLEVLSQARPEEVKVRVLKCLSSHASRSGILLSAGGGVSPGTPKRNIEALAAAAREF